MFNLADRTIKSIQEFIGKSLTNYKLSDVKMLHHCSWCQLHGTFNNVLLLSSRVLTVAILIPWQSFKNRQYSSQINMHRPAYMHLPWPQTLEDNRVNFFAHIRNLLVFTAMTLPQPCTSQSICAAIKEKAAAGERSVDISLHQTSETMTLMKTYVI